MTNFDNNSTVFFLQNSVTRQPYSLSVHMLLTHSYKSTL